MKLISKIKPSFNSQNINGTLFLAAMMIAAFLPEVSNATTATGSYTTTTFEKTLCNALDYVYGGTGAAVATLAVITLGFGAMLGKIAWTTVVICCVGIAAIFGANEIIEAISGTDPCTGVTV
jgi:type IV secretory pathway VirB2 component (pilin)